MKTMTIKDIAKMAGIGVSTVSRAMNDHSDVSAKTKEKVLKIIEENQYIPNNSARNLKRTDINAVGILVKAIDNPFFSKMIRVYEQEIHKERYDFFLEHVDEAQDEIMVAVQLAKEKRLKGIIFLGGHFNRSKKELNQVPVPYVLSTLGMDESLLEGILASSISVNDQVESKKMVEYLYSLGHRDIAFLSGTEKNESIGELRQKGYEEALLSHDIPINEEYIVPMSESYPPFSMECGYHMMKELMGRNTKVTAVFAISDIVAIGAMKAIFEAGKRVPEDYAVAGFDGLENSYYYEPSITTIEQPLERMAKESIRMLFTMIRTKKEVKNQVLDGELLKRASTEKF
ncbi:MAG: LacI family DNA-binding transcriptional regulator [Bacillota bacterium]